MIDKSRRNTHVYIPKTLASNVLNTNLNPARALFQNLQILALPPVSSPIRFVPDIVCGIYIWCFDTPSTPRMRVSNRQSRGARTRTIRASTAHAPVVSVLGGKGFVYVVAVAALYAHEMCAVALDEAEALLLCAGRGFAVAAALAAVSADRAAGAARAGFRVAAVAVEDVVEGELALCLVGRGFRRGECVVSEDGRELGELDVRVVWFVGCVLVQRVLVGVFV